MILAAALIAGAAPISGQSAPDALHQVSGELPDGGGSYRLAKPANWNGVLILDLDFAARPDAPLYKRLHELGYAGAGTTRGQAGDRGTAVDNPGRIARQLEALRLFTEKFGKPERVISFGFSGAGGLALALLEAAPEHIDGSVAACIITGSIGWFNSKLDAAFAAKTLIAPDNAALLLQNMPHDLAATSRAWTDALTAAQATPEGRARIALATALGRLPTWSSTTSPAPDPADLAGVQRAMFDTLSNQFGAALGGHVRVRRDFEESSGGPLSWNVGVSYHRLFANADAAQGDIVRKLYGASGLDLEADLRRLDRAPRLSADPAAVLRADQLMGITAKPQRPVLLFHTSGDWLAPPATLEAYTRRAPKALVRRALVEAPGHCTFSIAENVAAIRTVDQRIVDGRWPDTSPAAMNARAKAADTSAARFIPFPLRRFDRAFYTGDKPPSR